MKFRSQHVICAFACLLSLMAAAQTASLGADKGFISTVNFSESHDSSLGWATELDSTAGYDLNRHLNISAGVPVYLVQPTARTSGTQQTVNPSYHSLGDAFVNVNYKAGGALGYSGTVTATAPTGDTTHGISTGRATFGWNNRFEHAISRFAPFAEAGLANSNTTLERIHSMGNGHAHHGTLNDYTSLGGVSRFSGGSSIDLVRSLTLQASVYDELSFGNQKVYSRALPRGIAGGLTNTRKNPRHFDLSALTTGTASIADDNGFEASLTVDPNPRVEIGFSYQRSVHNALNTVAFSTSYTFGHVAGEKASK